MAKVAFVTGVTGFTGGWLAKRLVERGYSVRGLVRNVNKAANLKELGVELIQGDLRNKDCYKDGVNGSDVVFHVAAAYR
ncbi:MAG TPA: NAD-dependent epimerase/dehydratase family protein, partial [Bacteroidetes bacterium]|nr:NAD-dependent epimerase/dehydratase family protein [Bacteroidota bacterium]